MGFRAHLGMLVLAAAGAAGALGCLEPIQNGGVVILGDPHDRIAAMCRFRHNEATSELCGGDGEEAEMASAEARGGRRGTQAPRAETAERPPEVAPAGSPEGADPIPTN